jgi:tape measure domain-containing protein
VAVATVDIQVNSQGAVNSIRNVNNAAQRLESQVQGTTRSVKQLETAFAGLGVAVAGMNALNIAKDFFATANAADAAQRRIKMVSTGLDDYRLVMQTARNASAKFGLSQTEAANAVADIYTRLRPVGFGLSEINAIYEGFNTAVKLSSVEAGAASSAFLQLSQGLGSGTLQGDELRSVLEQMPSIAQAIAEEMNVTVGSIKKLGSEGKITSEVMVRALDRIRTEGAEKLTVSMDTPQQKIVALGTAMEDFKVAVASDVVPVVIGAIGQITVAIQNATQFVNDLKAGVGLLASAFSGVASSISSITNALSGTIGKFATLGQSKGLMMLLSIMTQGGSGLLSPLGQIAEMGARKNANKPFAAPIGPEMPIRLSMQGLNLGGGAAGKAGRTGGRGGAKSVRESQLVEIQAANGLYRSQETIKARIAKAQLDENQAEVLRLQYVDRGVQLLAEAAKIQRDKIPQVEKEAQLRGINDKLIASQNQYQREAFMFQKQAMDNFPSYISGIVSAASGYSSVLEYSKQLTVEQQKQKALADGIANTIGQGMTSAFDALISGTESFGTSLRKIASGVLQDIAKQLIQIFVINQAINAISSFFGPKTGGFGGGVKFNPNVFSMGSLLPGRAMGGPVSAGSSYMVGERGPELFTPKHGGSIVPNNALGGGSTSVVVNVDASGSNVQGDQAQAKQLGVVVSAAVQAELVKQQRPGGLLAGTRR